MKKTIRFMTAFLIILTFTGCGSNQNDNAITSNVEVGEKEKVNLSIGYIDAYSFQDLDSSINERIVSFNKSQDDYYIEIVKYGEDNYRDGLNALNADISAGKAPDIIAIDDETLLRQLGTKGVIEDLYGYIDDDAWPQRGDFVENILPCFEEDGKLYGLVPYFKILSVVGDPDDINSDRVTFARLKEMYEVSKDNDDITVYNALYRDFILDHCILKSLNTFVDMESKNCHFVNEEFQELLEFSAQFEDSGIVGFDSVEGYEKLQKGEICLLYDGVIGGFQEYTLYRELSGKNCRLPGFPSISGCGPEIVTNSSFLTINSDSEHKDIAWQFLCTFLDDRYLISDDNVGRSQGFPVTVSGFEMLAQKAMTANTGGGEGSFINTGGETITYPLYPTTEEEIAYLKKMISEVTPPEDYGEIETIVWEEIQSYWDGTKTVQETMEIIQNRAQLYLDEL